MTETKTIKPIETVVYGLKCRSRLEARTAVLFHEMGWSFEYEPEGFELPDGTWYLPDFLLHNVYLSKGFGSFKTGVERRRLGDVYVEAKGRWTNDDFAKTYELANAGYNVLTVEEILDPGDAPSHLFRNLSESMKNYIEANKTEYNGREWNYCRVGDWEWGLHCFTFLGKAEKCSDCWPNCEHRNRRGFDGMCPVKIDNHMILCASAVDGVPLIKRLDPYGFGYEYRPEAVKWDQAQSNFGEDCWEEKTLAAYTAARQARFEHGETPRTTNIAL